MADMQNTIALGGADLLNPSPTGVGGAANGGSNPNGNDPILADLETLFGGRSSQDSSDGGAANKAGKSPSTQYVDGDPFGPAPTPKDPEGLLRKLQSERDKARADLEKVTGEANQYKGVAQFVNSLFDDEEARHAFIAELEPNLVKPKDALTFVKEGLKKEFGDEFTPNQDESNVFGSPTWLYNERAKDMFNEWKDKSKKLPASLKELKEKRNLVKEEQAKAALAERNSIKEMRKWDDGKFDRFANWVTSIKGIHMAAIFDTIEARRSSSVPSLTGLPGGAPMTSSKSKAAIDELFG